MTASRRSVIHVAQGPFWLVSRGLLSIRYHFLLFDQVRRDSRGNRGIDHWPKVGWVKSRAFLIHENYDRRFSLGGKGIAWTFGVRRLEILSLFQGGSWLVFSNNWATTLGKKETVEIASEIRHGRHEIGRSLSVVRDEAKILPNASATLWVLPR